MAQFIGADPYGRRQLNPRKSIVLYNGEGLFRYALNENPTAPRFASCTSRRRFAIGRKEFERHPVRGVLRAACSRGHGRGTSVVLRLHRRPPRQTTTGRSGSSNRHPRPSGRGCSAVCVSVWVAGTGMPATDTGRHVRREVTANGAGSQSGLARFGHRARNCAPNQQAWHWAGGYQSLIPLASDRPMGTEISCFF